MRIASTWKTHATAATSHPDREPPRPEESGGRGERVADIHRRSGRRTNALEEEREVRDGRAKQREKDAGID